MSQISFRTGPRLIKEKESRTLSFVEIKDLTMFHQTYD